MFEESVLDRYLCFYIKFLLSIVIRDEETVSRWYSFQKGQEPSKKPAVHSSNCCSFSFLHSTQPASADEKYGRYSRAHGPHPSESSHGPRHDP